MHLLQNNNVTGWNVISRVLCMMLLWELFGNMESSCCRNILNTSEWLNFCITGIYTLYFHSPFCFSVSIVNAIFLISLYRSSSIDLSEFVDNGEWELVSARVQRNVVFYNCCPEPFPDVTFFFHLRRRITYYIMNIIIPCIVLSVLCLAGFLLPAESGEKVTLGLSVLLTLTVFMLMVADKTPQTSESVSVIGIYLLVVLTTSCLSVLTAVIVLGIHHQRGKPEPLPRWLRVLAFRIVAPVLCVRFKRRKIFQRANSVVEDKTKRKSRSRVRSETYELLKIESKKIDTVNEEPLFYLEGKCALSDYQQQVYHMIHVLQCHHEVELRDEDTLREWREAAVVIDRLLFVLFLISTTLSTAILLTLRPPG